MTLRIAVLGGGPDAEREVSIESSTAVTKGLVDAGLNARLHLIDQTDSLAHIEADVIVPVLHGRWGEGGALQDILERDGRPYVGCGPRAARLCMDKIAAKLEAARLGIRTAPAQLLNINDRVDMRLPYVIKPALEGSSVGLHICHTEQDAERAFELSSADVRANPGQVVIVEKMIVGREITSPVLERDGKLEALPLVSIEPAEGVYDFEAKYKRDDTVYTVEPEGLNVETIQNDTLRFAEAVGIRHLARVDYIIDERGDHWFLEANTMPGFTAHSLVPQAAARVGMPMPDLCAHLAKSACSALERASGASHSSLKPC
ncbi:MAG: D-alanine--D-alanine ligase [Phycisphaerales bacterium]